MAKIDIYNRGGRDYTLPNGKILLADSALSVDQEMGERMMTAYPKDIISPEALRSGPSAQSNKDKDKEISRLQGIVRALEIEVESLKVQIQSAPLEATKARFPDLVKENSELRAQNENLTRALDQMLEGKKSDLELIVEQEA